MASLRRESYVLVALALLSGSATAHAYYWLRQWNPNIENPDNSRYYCDVNAKTVYIYQGDLDNIFKFEAFETTDNSPQDINLIVSYTTGVVRVMVAGNGPGRTEGARHVREIRAWPPAAPIELVSLNITGDLGQDGLSSFSSFHAIIGGDLLNQLSSTTTLESSRLIVVGTLAANVECARLGNVNIYGAGPHTGNITATAAPYYGTLRVFGTYGGTLSLASSYGPLTFYGDLTHGHVSLPYGLVRNTIGPTAASRCRARSTQTAPFRSAPAPAPSPPSAAPSRSATCPDRSC